MTTSYSVLEIGERTRRADFDCRGNAVRHAKEFAGLNGLNAAIIEKVEYRWRKKTTRFVRLFAYGNTDVLKSVGWDYARR